MSILSWFFAGALLTGAARPGTELEAAPPTRPLPTATQPLNLLFYGNSYTAQNGTVSALVKLLAEAAGFPSPVVVAKLSGGATLGFHLSNASHAAAITESLAAGDEWDFVVLQGQSLEATAALGSPGQFRANAVSIATNLRAHSPNARTCLFQTWARGAGHSYYQGASPTFAGPVSMHRQIERNYERAAMDIEAVHGAGSARRAAAGGTAHLHAFDSELYTADLSHPAPSLSVMAALAIFSTIYEVRPCELRLDFAGGSTLVQTLTGWGIDATQWAWLAGISGRVLDPALRRFPGSSDDLLLTSGAPGALTACSTKSMPAGVPLGLRLESPNGRSEGDLSILYADLSPTSPPWTTHATFPEIHFGQGSTVLLQAAALPASGRSIDWLVPPSLAGRYALIQGHVATASLTTGNAFTTTDAHEIRFLGAPRHRKSRGAPAPLAD